MTGYSELVKALTCGNDGKLPCHNNECPYWVDQWHGIGLCNVIKKDADAADAIEALQAEIRESMQRCAECGDELAHQMPKQGEWKKWADKHGMTQLVRLVCSECGKDIVVSKENIPNYCPNCGAKMEVQDESQNNRSYRE